MPTRKKKEVTTAANAAEPSTVFMLLIDVSASMAGREKIVAEGVNAYITTQAKDNPDSRIQLIEFGTGYTVKSSALAKDMPIYVPPQRFGDGNTALYGSYGYALEQLVACDAKNRTLNIFTDGESNEPAVSSFSYNLKNADTLKKLTAKAKAANINILLFAIDVNLSNFKNRVGLTDDDVTNVKAANIKPMMQFTAAANTRSTRGGQSTLTALEKDLLTKTPEEIAAATGEELVTLAKARKILVDAYKTDKTQFFSVTFKKRTAPYDARTYAKAQFHVTSKMKTKPDDKTEGGKKEERLFHELVNVYVHDADTEGYRSIALEGIIALRFGGKAYRVKSGSSVPRKKATTAAK